MYPKAKLVLWILFLVVEGIWIVTCLPATLVLLPAIHAGGDSGPSTAVQTAFVIWCILPVMCGLEIILLWPSRFLPRCSWPRLWMLFLAAEGTLLVPLLMAPILFFGTWSYLGPKLESAIPVLWTAFVIWAYLVFLCGLMVIVLRPRKSDAPPQAT